MPSPDLGDRRGPSPGSESDTDIQLRAQLSGLSRMPHVPVSSSLQGAEEATASRPPFLQAAVQLKGKTLPGKERSQAPTAVRAP